MPKRRLLIFGLMSLLLLIAVGGSQAQQETAVCPALVERALRDIGSNCDAVDRNNACYGFNRVDTAFFEPQPEGFFSLPADRAALSELLKIQTVPLNSVDDEWGVAVLNVQANVPGALPGQAAVFLLYGDVELENAVTPDQAFLPGDMVEVTALVTANGRSGPGGNFNVVAGIPIGAVLSADGLSGDGAWVRALYEETSVWVSRDLVQPEVQGSLSTLPVISPNARTPMQAMHLRTGVGGLECLDAPSVLVIQGPENVRVQINVNGADIQIGSTIALRTTADNFLQLITLSGVAFVDGIPIPPGFTIQFPLTPDGMGVAGPWTGFRPLTPEELESLRWIENTPTILLHYRILLPSMNEILRTLAAINQRNAPSTSGNDDSSSGDPGSCGGFAATSPLEAAQTGDHTFYWDPAPGADSYRWILLAGDGSVMKISDTQQTNYTATLPASYPSTLQWEVHALAGGQEICSTARVIITLIGGGQSGASNEEDEPSGTVIDQRTCIATGGTWDPVKRVCYYT